MKLMRIEAMAPIPPPPGDPWAVQHLSRGAALSIRMVHRGALTMTWVAESDTPPPAAASASTRTPSPCAGTPANDLGNLEGQKPLQLGAPISCSAFPPLDGNAKRESEQLARYTGALRPKASTQHPISVRLTLPTSPPEG
eukprot:scaffold7328_cov314-Pinguiococcus_pyrenoidosus.AAC.4